MTQNQWKPLERLRKWLNGWEYITDYDYAIPPKDTECYQ